MDDDDLITCSHYLPDGTLWSHDLALLPDPPEGERTWADYRSCALPMVLESVPTDLTVP